MCAANVTLKNKKKQGGGRGEHGEYGHEYNNYSIYTHIYTREYIYIHVYTYINTRTDRYICLSHVNFSHIPPCCPATQWPYPKASPVTCWRQYCKKIQEKYTPCVSRRAYLLTNLLECQMTPVFSPHAYEGVNSFLFDAYERVIVLHESMSHGTFLDKSGGPPNESGVFST